MLQDSFEIPQGQASRGGDIELGAQASMNSGELGLESFFKQVLWLDFCLPWTSWEDKRSLSFSSFSFCIYLIIHLYMGFIKLISMVLPSYVYDFYTISWCLQVTEIEKQYGKLDNLLKKLQVRIYTFHIPSWRRLLCHLPACHNCLANHVFKIYTTIELNNLNFFFFDK